MMTALKQGACAVVAAVVTFAIVPEEYHSTNERGYVDVGFVRDSLQDGRKLELYRVAHPRWGGSEPVMHIEVYSMYEPFSSPSAVTQGGYGVGPFMDSLRTANASGVKVTVTVQKNAQNLHELFNVLLPPGEREWRAQGGRLLDDENRAARVYFRAEGPFARLFELYDDGGDAFILPN
jgi:hypothetical protein